MQLSSTNLVAVGRQGRGLRLRDLNRAMPDFTRDLETRIILSVCALGGETFFREIVRHLAELTGSPYAFILALDQPGATSGRLLAAWNDGSLEQGLTVDLSGTPCERVVRSAQPQWFDDVRSRFPYDPRMTLPAAPEYRGCPILSREGEVIGLFGVLGRGLGPSVASLDTLERVFAARALVEMERLRESTRLGHLATHDPVTDLPNRTLLIDRLDQALSRASWHGNLVAALRVDVLRMSAAGDTLPPSLAQRLEEQVAWRLSSCVRESDTVGRLGHEEFAVVLADVRAPEDAVAVARKITAAFTPPFRVDGQQLVLPPRLGIALYPSDGADAELLLRHAEVAAHQARTSPHPDFRFYSASMNELVSSRFRLETQVRQAVERGEFEVYYQPQTDARGRITGVEALLRWRHPVRGLIGPSEFVPLLEETGLIVGVGEWVLRRSCAQMKAWRQAGLPLERIGVNLSARQLREPSLPAMVARVLDETGLDAGDLELEITEGMIEDADEALRILHCLSQMGVQLAIDDFGVGYSSLSQLKRFPIDTLKIDQTFIRDVATSPGDAAITRALIAMGRSLELRIVAEGVETSEQLAFLDGERCLEFQGFLFGKALPADEMGRRFS